MTFFTTFLINGRQRKKILLCWNKLGLIPYFLLLCTPNFTFAVQVSPAKTLTLHCQICTPADTGSQAAAAWMCSDTLMGEWWLWLHPCSFCLHVLLLQVQTQYVCAALSSVCCNQAHCCTVTYGGARHAHDTRLMRHPGLLTTCNNAHKSAILWYMNTLHEKQTQSRQLKSNLVRPFI